LIDQLTTNQVKANLNFAINGAANESDVIFRMAKEPQAQRF